MKFKVGLCQFGGGKDIDSNLEKAGNMAVLAVGKGAEVIAFPEMWNCPYSNSFFREYGEKYEKRTRDFMSDLAGDLGVYLIGGSIPEISEGNVYNTSYIYNRTGKEIGKHRKVHMFDINVKGGIAFKESDVLSPGDKYTVVDTEFGKLGIAICFDVRFSEMFMSMARDGAKMVFLPAAFNMTTGPAHWDLTMRARALDNQIYLAAISDPRVEGSVYQAYGHSCLIDPWGNTVARADTDDELIIGEVDFDYVDSVREQLPILSARRPEIYK